MPPISPAASVPPPGPKRKRANGCGVVALILLAVIAGGGLWAWRRLAPGGAGITLRISASQLQKALQPAFPVDRKSFLLDVHLSDPTVELNPADNDRIGFGAAVVASIRGRKMASGTVEADGKLRYDAPTRTFYLDSPKIKELKIDRVGGPEGLAIRKAVTYVLQKAVRNLPVDQLDPTDPVQRIAARGIRSVRVVDGAVEITFGQSLP